jgi:hypothetical protein
VSSFFQVERREQDKLSGHQSQARQQSCRPASRALMNESLALESDRRSFTRQLSADCVSKLDPQATLLVRSRAHPSAIAFYE